jgi:hypothetical protein
MFYQLQVSIFKEECLHYHKPYFREDEIVPCHLHGHQHGEGQSQAPTPPREFLKKENEKIYIANIKKTKK